MVDQWQGNEMHDGFVKEVKFSQLYILSYPQRNKGYSNYLMILKLPGNRII